MSVSVLVCFLMSVVSVSTLHVRYVKPNYTSPLGCPGQPCLTLDQYAQQAAKYFNTGSIFVFLAGDHSLRTTVNLTNVSNLTFEGNYSDDGIRVICNDRASFLFDKSKTIIIRDLTFLLQSNEGYYTQTSALILQNTKDVSILTCKFQNKGVANRAIYSYDSTLTIVSCLFEKNKGKRGGAIQAWHGTLTLTGCSFIGNYALIEGGAIYLWYSAMFLKGTLENNFTQNSCERFGGAVICVACVIDMTNTNHFENNSALGFSGGAIYLSKGHLFYTSGSAIFSYNKAAILGGALYLIHSSVTFTRSVILTFFRNSADVSGSGIHCTTCELVLDSERLYFTNNFGSAIDIRNYDTTKLLVLSGNFENNIGKCGGGVSVDSRSSVTFKKVNFINNSEGALCVLNSKVSFTENTQFLSNSGKLGGAINLKNSFLMSRDFIRFDFNKASHGGAVYSLFGMISFANGTVLLSNTASKDGGALYAIGTTISFTNSVNISRNSAQRGGAMFLMTAFLRLRVNTALTTSHNHASSQGGVIFNEDSAVPVQCDFNNDFVEDQLKIVELPYCFLQSGGILFHDGILLPGDKNLDEDYTVSISINSFEDSAGKIANFIYGGLLDRCKFDILYRAEIDTANTKPVSILPYELLTEKLIHAQNVSATNLLSSMPYKLCFCEKIQLFWY